MMSEFKAVSLSSGHDEAGVASPFRVVPPGWKLVPIEPTPEMVRAAVRSRWGSAIYKVPSALIEEDETRDDYAAMLAAAPSQAAPTEVDAPHTPGPWTHFILNIPLSEIGAYAQQCTDASSGEDFYFVSAPFPEGEGDADICHVGNGPRGAFNARLIAAAPDMLEALQELFVPRPIHRRPSGFDLARAAILKATGAPPAGETA